jgi:hypothetical protein
LLFLESLFRNYWGVKMPDKQKTVDMNLDLMFSNKEGGMTYLFLGDSAGGNAGSSEDFSCSAANFNYDEKTGLIKYFANSPLTPEERSNGCLPGYFRLKMALDDSGIIEAYFSPTTDTARKVLSESAREYNRRTKSKVREILFADFLEIGGTE